LSSEASRRFERGMDNELGPSASARASALLTEFGGAHEVGAIEVDRRESLRVIEMNVNFPSKVIGTPLTDEEVRHALIAVGCTIDDAKTDWKVTVPSWRTDIVGKADLVEEVIRIVGYERIPTVVPTAPSGLGLTPAQRLRRRVSHLVAQAGAVEVLSYPFMGAADLDALRIPLDDPRRKAVSLANPISAESPMMRTTLLAPLMATARRNVGRGHTDVAVYEMGLVVLPTSETLSAPQLPIDKRPTDEQLNQLNESVPFQPEYVAAVLGGLIQRGESVLTLSKTWSWSDAIGLALRIVETAGLTAETVSMEREPWHPGRVAAISVDGNVVGFAGELHPRVVEGYGLPARSCALELDFSALSAMAQHITSATLLRSLPKATFDVALVVPQSVPAAVVREVIERNAGELLESAEIFDVYTGAQVAESFKSVAVAVTLRAADRTLTDAEIGAVREQVVQAASDTLGAVLR
jgi:phenylalanyl-tRNA synthetase beta chain